MKGNITYTLEAMVLSGCPKSPTQVHYIGSLATGCYPSGFLLDQVDPQQLGLSNVAT